MVGKALMIQGSPEWFAARLGKVTASRVADLTARTKTGWGASRATYMGELIAERLTGVPASSYSNQAMQWGTEKEPEARVAYEFHTSQPVTLVGFIEHPIVPMSGASPDGLVGEDGMVEIKCPNTATHIDTLLGKTVPAKYVTQIMWQMACTGRKWCDFVSFDPRMPDAMQLFVYRVDRDDIVIKQLEREVTAFMAELLNKLSALRSTYELKQVLQEAAE